MNDASVSRALRCSLLCALDMRTTIGCVTRCHRVFLKTVADTFKNSFVGRIVLSRGARNPHVPGRTFRLLCSGLLTLHP
jgi:hypothetical protein